MISIAFGAIATWIATHPESRKLADDAIGWAASRVVRALTTTPEDKRDASIEVMRTALAKGDVDAIIDQFSANHDYAAQFRVSGDPGAKGPAKDNPPA